MNTDGFSHVIEISESERLLTIYRVRQGQRELYTSVKLPETTWGKNRHAVQEFCRVLGENIVLDSPVARKLLGA